MKRIISFSVYGHESHYSLGAIANAVAAKQFFPEWTARFYLDQNLVAPLGCQLESLGSECVLMDSSDGHSGTFWRFLPASDPSVDVVIVRDVDALLCPRNKCVVDEWIDSGKGFHIIRDHPHHQHPILGGALGCKKRSHPQYTGSTRSVAAQIKLW